MDHFIQIQVYPKLRKAAALAIVNPIYKARNLFKTKWKVTGRKVALEIFLLDEMHNKL